MTGYYDYVLGLIPVALLGVTAVLALIGVALTLAIPVGASVAVALIGHALFVNGPVAADPDTVAKPGSQSPAAVPVNAD